LKFKEPEEIGATMEPKTNEEPEELGICGSFRLTEKSPILREPFTLRES
jgi:hypothetical protein